MRIAQGWQFLALNSELKMMVSKAQELVAELGMQTASDLARY
jgi:4-hydroxy-2-oxoheptanedioate aldolase